MASIFKTLEGGHLDRALFGSRPERTKPDPRNDGVVQRYASRSRRLFGRGERVSEDDRRKTGTDPEA
jgi:hypothetical protein